MNRKGYKTPFHRPGHKPSTQIRFGVVLAQKDIFTEGSPNKIITLSLVKIAYCITNISNILEHMI